jgi:hypothetical protein
MTWTKQIDRAKFPSDTYVIIGWSDPAQKWFAALCHNDALDDAPAIAAGEGCDPVEAMISLAVDAGALAETGEWRAE